MITCSHYLCAGNKNDINANELLHIMVVTALKEEIPAGIIVGVCVGALMVIIAVVLFIFICR